MYPYIKSLVFQYAIKAPYKFKKGVKKVKYTGDRFQEIRIPKQ
jgi:hypothetical protein